MVQSWKMRSLSIALVLSMVCLALPAFGQQPTVMESPKPEEKAAVIRFFAEVNPGTVGALLQTVDAQYKSGMRKFVILMSSGGGDLLSGFMAYNYLKGLPIEVTTFNVGNVDSSASIIYCAGTKRYAVPEARFVIHEVALTFQANGPGTMNIDLPSLETQLSILKGQESSMARILAMTVNKPQTDAEAKIHAQSALSSDEAKKWGLVQEIRTQLFDPNNSNLVMAIPPPTVQQEAPTVSTVPQFSSVGTPSSK
jgi:ATP-dependent Clp protease, protease subunit